MERATGTSRLTAIRALVKASPAWPAAHYVRSALAARANRAAFRSVRTYCLFVGHARSGHSILGALLDAHRRAVVSDELDALRYLGWGFGRDQLLQLSLDVSRAQAQGERRKAGRDGRTYSYFVPGQWQGRFEELLVVGDSKAGWTTRRLAADPSLLDRVERVMAPIEVRFVHVVRNPFDNVSTMVIRSGRPLDEAIERYFENCRTIVALAARIGPDRVLRVAHEDLVERPRETLRETCRFLGLDAPDDYLAACAGILFPTPSRSRDRVPWSAERRERVAREIERFEFLAGYTFDA
ncbi:MAG TPA: sulfotransferase [Candidatus Limnocylindrales bacterium]|nr:sulfotransferase [Candidatus Limnocylindrales bacterium]